MARILIAEDEPDIRELIAFTMRFAGHEVTTTANGEEALQQASQLMPDIIIMDVRMPKMTGYDACEIIKFDPDLWEIPVVFLSAKGQDSEIQKGLDVGAEAYMLKPFAPTQLTSEIKNILAKFDPESIKKSRIEKDKNQEYINYLINRVKRLRYDANSLRFEISKHKEQIEEMQKLLESKLSGRQDFLSRLNQFLISFMAIFNVSIKAPDTAVKSLPAKLESQYPLAELSLITAGIVHDIKNGLAAIGSTINFMPNDPSISSDLERISNNVDYCDRILRNLSGLSGQITLRLEQVDLEEILSKTYFMLKNKLVDVDLVIDTDNKKPVIQADKGQMEQVFMNLIINAGEAMPDGGPLNCCFRQEDNMMRIEFQDAGCGISKENQKRLFVEFFSTKGRGSGIGLYNVHNIIEHHGGKISVESEEGKGTTFSILLPITGK